MKVLLVTSYFPPLTGGSAVVYYNICKYLGSEASVLTTQRHYVDGHRIDFESLDPVNFKVSRIEFLRPPYTGYIKPNSVVAAFRFLSIDIPIMLEALRAVLDIVRNERVDVVCFGEVYSLGWLGVVLRKLKAVPCIHYIHGEEITAGVSSRLYGRGALRALRKAEAVVVVSEFTRREVIRRGVPADRVHLISNGVDLDIFSPGPKDPAIMSKHCVEGKTVMLTVGRLEPRKGHDTVIQALPEILKEVPDLVYVIVGAGSDGKRLRGLAEAVGVKDKVIFAGRVPNDELIAYYRTADLFIMPNRTLEDGDTEGFGLVFLEANACGKPVIGGNAGGVPDAVVDGVTGLLVDGKSVKAVADAAVRILRNPELAERLGEAGRRRALTFGWEKKAKEFRTLCERLARK